MRKIIPLAIVGFALTGAAAGCATGTHSSVTTPATHSPAPAHTASPAPTTNALGTTFKVTDTMAGANGDSTAVYTVQAVKILDPAAPDNSFDAAPSGQHLVAVEINLKGVSGNESDDAGNDAVLVGSNHEDYQTGDGGVAAGTDFNEGQFNLSPGSSLTGWVNFDVPNGVTVHSVQWTPDSGEASSVSTWTVGQ